MRTTSPLTPHIEERLRASLRAQAMGFEVRWRIDPIFPLDQWRDVYSGFFASAAAKGHTPTRITLGTYRETNPSLAAFVEKWGLPPMEWRPTGLRKDGAHYHLAGSERVEIYAFLAQAIRKAWRGSGHEPIVALCKEPRSIRRAVSLDHEMCNCG